MEAFRDNLSILSSCTLCHPVFSMGNVLNPCRAWGSQASSANP